MEFSEIFNSLLAEISGASLQGFLGVGFICAYFLAIFCLALYRIKKGEHTRPS